MDDDEQHLLTSKPITNSVQNNLENFVEEDHFDEAPPKKERLFTKAFINILISGTVLSLIYTAFFPGVGLQDVVITDSGKNMSGKVGFYGQGITYISSVLLALLAPLIINTVGIRASLSSSALMYVGLFIGIIFLEQWTIYLGSAVTGFGLGLLWVVAPKIVTDNSTDENLQRNQSLFWCIYMMSMVIGNMANYFYLGHLTRIGTQTRVVIYLVCCVVVACGSITGLIGYRTITPTFDHYLDLISSKSLDLDADSTLKKQTKRDRITDMLRLYKSTICRREVAFLCSILVFNAVTLSFYTMTFQTCIGNTFSQRNLIPLMGLVFGVVEVIGSLVFERVTEKIGNKPTTVFLYFVALLSFYLIFLSFPKAATYEDVMEEGSYIVPREWLVLLIAVLIATYDNGFNILGITTVGRLFQANSEIGFMLLNSIMSLTAGSLFLISSAVSLYTILGLELLLCTATTIVIVFDLAVEKPRERQF